MFLSFFITRILTFTSSTIFQNQTLRMQMYGSIDYRYQQNVDVTVYDPDQEVVYEGRAKETVCFD